MLLSESQRIFRLSVGKRRTMLISECEKQSSKGAERSFSQSKGAEQVCAYFVIHLLGTSLVYTVPEQSFPEIFSIKEYLKHSSYSKFSVL